MKKITLILLSLPFLFAFYGNHHSDIAPEQKTEGEEIKAPGKRYRPIIIHPEYEHNKWGKKNNIKIILIFSWNS